MNNCLKIPLFFVALLMAGPSWAQQTEHRFEQEVRAFDTQDKQTPPPRQPILFVGS